MNYELSDKLKSAIEEEITRLACLSDMSKEVALGSDFASLRPRESTLDTE